MGLLVSNQLLVIEVIDYNKKWRGESCPAFEQRHLDYRYMIRHPFRD
jgi:hypothetical protein